jgi:hypothetical protein
MSPIHAFSLLDHLKEEVLAHELDGARELKSERIANFLAVPMAIEQVLICYSYSLLGPSQQADT